MKHKDTTAILIHVPQDVKDWVEKEAARTLASQNSEILRCIRARMDSEPKKAAECQCERDRKPSWSRSRFVPPRNALSVRNAKARSSTLAVCPKRVVGGVGKINRTRR